MCNVSFAIAMPQHPGSAVLNLEINWYRAWGGGLWGVFEGALTPTPRQQGVDRGEASTGSTRWSWALMLRWGKPCSALPTPGPDAQNQEDHDWQTNVAQRGQVCGGRPLAPWPEATSATPATPTTPATTRGGSNRSARGIRPSDGHVGRGESPCEVADCGMQRIGTAPGTRVAKRRVAAPIRGVYVCCAYIRARQGGEVDVRT